MTPTLAALATTASKAGAVGVLLIVAAALVVPRERVRAVLAVAALAAAPALLLVDLGDSPQIESIRNQPAKAAAAAAIGLLAVAVLAVLIHRNGKLFPYLAAVALPFRLPIEVGGETANLLLPLYAVIAAGTIAWAVPLVAGRVADSEFRPTLLDWALGGWLALFGIGALWSTDPAKAMQDAIFFYVPFAVLFLLLRRVEWTAELVRGCALALVALALAFSALGFYEYWTRTLLLNPKLLISNQFHTYFRVNSVFFDPNIFGRFLMLVMIGVAAVLLDTKRGRTVAACSATLAVLLGALVLTLSQSSIVGLIAGLAALAALRWPAKWILGGSAVLLAIAIAAVIALPQETINVGSLRSLNTQSSGRAGLVSGGVELFASKPVAGWGSGSFSTAYRRERGAGSAAAVTASHTTPVTAAAEQGVIGLAIYLLVLIAAFLAAVRRARLSTARAAVTAGLVALVVHSLTYAAFLEDPASWTLFALAAALPIPLTRDERRAARESSRAIGPDADRPAAAPA